MRLQHINLVRVRTDLNILHFLTRNRLFNGSNHQIRLVEHDGMTSPGGDEVGAIG